MRRAVHGFALCLAVAFVMLAPSTVRALGHLLPTPASRALPTLVADELKIGATAFLGLLALSLDSLPAQPSRAARRWHVITALAVVTALALLFTLSGARTRGAFLAVQGPGVALLICYNLLFTGYALWCLARLTKALAAHARAAEPGPLRLGLVLGTATSALAMLWTSWTADDIVAVLRHSHQDSGEDVISTTFGVFCMLLLVGTATATAWGTAEPLRWLRARRTHRALEPLWTALHTELPDLALPPPPPTGRRFDPQRAEFALYRRVIEIRDGHLALRPYVHPDVPAWAAEANAPGAPHAALLEAASLTAALEAHRAGHRPGPARADAAGHSPHPTLNAEITWLLQVTDAFTHSPVIPHVRRRARAAAGSRPEQGRRLSGAGALDAVEDGRGHRAPPGGDGARRLDRGPGAGRGTRRRPGRLHRDARRPGRRRLDAQRAAPEGVRRQILMQWEERDLLHAMTGPGRGRAVRDLPDTRLGPRSRR
jgi:hypothetical protein